MIRLTVISLLTTLSLPVVYSQEPGAPPPVAPEPPGLLDTMLAFKEVTGRKDVAGVVEIRGGGGMPQPKGWTIVIHDSQSPTSLTEYRVSNGRAEPGVPNEQFYPRKEPSGFFDLSKVEVDSVGAFRIADRAAGLAKIGFDVIDYKVRARELGDDPVWILTLRGEGGGTRGVVTLSARSGKLMRTVWHRRNASGEVSLVDSAAPGAEPLPQPASETRLPPPVPAEPEKAPSPPSVEVPADLRPLTPPPVPNVLPE